MLNYSKIILLPSILMVDFISLSGDTITVQASGDTPTEALESILSQLSNEAWPGIIVIEPDLAQVFKTDNTFHNKKRFQLRIVSPGFTVNLDPDSLV